MSVLTSGLVPARPQDEPTNYLDRDSLGALADSIKVFEGGVVMISHNNGAHLHLPQCQPDALTNCASNLQGGSETFQVLVSLPSAVVNDSATAPTVALLDLSRLSQNDSMAEPDQWCCWRRRVHERAVRGDVGGEGRHRHGAAEGRAH